MLFFLENVSEKPNEQRQPNANDKENHWSDKFYSVHKSSY